MLFRVHHQNAGAHQSDPDPLPRRQRDPDTCKGEPMKYLKAMTIAMLGITAPVAGQAAAGGMGPAPVGKQATITGTVIDISCKFGQGLSGESHRMCTQVCGDNGLPLAILGSDGKLYIPTTADMPGSGQNDKLKPFAEQEVRVTGKVFTASGAQAIQIASIAVAR